MRGILKGWLGQLILIAAAIAVMLLFAFRAVNTIKTRLSEQLKARSETTEAVR